MKGDIFPDANMTRDIGSSSLGMAEVWSYAYHSPNSVIKVVGTVKPDGDNTRDIGAAGLEFKNLYLDGIARIDALFLDSIYTKTTTYTITINDSIILVQSAGGAFTMTLPAASTAKGQILIIKKIDADANAVTLDGDGAETIDGQATNAEIDANYDMLMLICDGSEWHIVGRWIH